MGDTSLGGLHQDTVRVIEVISMQQTIVEQNHFPLCLSQISCVDVGGLRARTKYLVSLLVIHINESLYMLCYVDFSTYFGFVA